VFDTNEAYLQIGEVAERTGVTQRTLRFYEEKGLLRSPTRMEGGFRLYSEDDVRHVEHIRRLQNLLGVTLAEIKEMVEAEEVLRELKAQYRPESDVSEKKRQLQEAINVVTRQHGIVSQKAEQMSEMKAQLEERLQTFARWMTELEHLERKAPVA
jgi:DNA-binding transcriptional MerR regulator